MRKREVFFQGVVPDDIFVLFCYCLVAKSYLTIFFFFISESFGTPWTIACQPPLFMGFSMQEWSELPFYSPGNIPDPAMEPTSLIDIFCLGSRFFTTRAPGKVPLALYCVQITPPKKGFYKSGVF